MMSSQKLLTGAGPMSLAQSSVRGEVSEGNSDGPQRSDAIFFGVLNLSSLIILVLLFSIFITLLVYSLPSIKAFGVSFFIDKTWDPVTGEFGALSFLLGTLITSFLSLVISLPFSALGGNVKEAGSKLVVAPAKFTFQRPLGEF